MVRIVHTLHHCQSGRPRAISSCSWDWALPFQYFFCIHRYTNRNGAFPRIFFITFSLWTFRNISLYYLSCLKSICRLMNAQKTRNSKGRQGAMETNFYSMDFFFSFTRIFLDTFRKNPYNFFLCCVRISRIMNAKKSRNSRGTTRAMESRFYSIDFFFSFTRIFLHTFWNIPYNFFYAVFVFPE